MMGGEGMAEQENCEKLGIFRFLVGLAGGEPAPAEVVQRMRAGQLSQRIHREAPVSAGVFCCGALFTTY